jgi:hypothetical protein
MNCEISQEILIDFQYGLLLDMETRDQVEAHLAECPGCLQEFFLLKRDVESAQATPLTPSNQVKARIHREFIAWSYGRMQKHPRKFLIGGLVAVAALLLVIFSGQNHHASSDKPRTDDAPKAEMVRSLDETVDSAGMNPGHINIM